MIVKEKKCRRQTDEEIFDKWKSGKTRFQGGPSSNHRLVADRGYLVTGVYIFGRRVCPAG